MSTHTEEATIVDEDGEVTIDVVLPGPSVELSPDPPPPDELPAPAKSLRHQLMEVDDLFDQLITVPAWGGVEILMRSPSLLTRHKFLAWHQQLDDVIKGDEAVSECYRAAATIVMCAHDPKTEEPLFSYSDVPWLVQRNHHVMIGIINAANRVTAMTAEAYDLGKGGSLRGRTSI